jgi:hypothetical protein
MRRPVVTHLGLGDAFIQAGAAVVLNERHGEIAWPCYEQYKPTLESFFVDYPGISIYTLPHKKDWDWGSPPDFVYDRAIKAAGMEGVPHIRAGVYAGVGIGWDFSQAFYEHLSIPYTARWDRSPIREATKKVEQVPVDAFPNQERKIFVHDDPSRGYTISRLVNRNAAFRPDFSDPSLSILRYGRLIETADEIHVIDSSFFWFVNALQPRAKLFFHCYARWPRGNDFRFPSKQDWTYLF